MSTVREEGRQARQQTREDDASCTARALIRCDSGRHLFDPVAWTVCPICARPDLAEASTEPARGSARRGDRP